MPVNAPSKSIKHLLRSDRLVKLTQNYPQFPIALIHIFLNDREWILLIILVNSLSRGGPSHQSEYVIPPQIEHAQESAPSAWINASCMNMPNFPHKSPLLCESLGGFYLLQEINPFSPLYVLNGLTAFQSTPCIGLQWVNPKANANWVYVSQTSAFNPPQDQVHISTFLRKVATWMTMTSWLPTSLLLEEEFFHKLGVIHLLLQAKGVRDHHLPGLAARGFLQAVSPRQLLFSLLIWQGWN